MLIEIVVAEINKTNTVIEYLIWRPLIPFFTVAWHTSPIKVVKIIPSGWKQRGVFRIKMIKLESLFSTCIPFMQVAVSATPLKIVANIRAKSSITTFYDRSRIRSIKT
jgi:hypothetical protein